MSINFLPWREQREIRRQRLWLGGFIVTWLAIGITATVVLNYEQEQYEQLKQKVVRLKDKITSVKIQNAEPLYHALQQKVTFVQQKRQLLLTLLNTLHDTTQTIPESVYLMSLQWNRPLLTLTGVSSNSDIITSWLESLNDNKYIEQIKPTYHHEINNNTAQQNFSVEITVK